MNAAPRILIVRLSSLGDVVHNLPVLHDIKAHFPDSDIDWLVDSSCAEALTYCQHLGTVIELPLRRWRNLMRQRGVLGGLLTLPTLWRDFLAWRQHLRQRHYDIAIDLQGLIKSALFMRCARAKDYVGLANRSEGSSYEPLARAFYRRRVTVPSRIHAVERGRLVAAQALGFAWQQGTPWVCDFLPIPRPVAAPPRYALFLHGTSRTSKTWDESHWLAVGRFLLTQGFALCLPQSNLVEAQRAERLAAALGEDCQVLPKISLREIGAYVAHAAVVVGVDSGLSHLACALGRPNVQIYCGDALAWRTAWPEVGNNRSFSAELGVGGAEVIACLSDLTHPALS